MRRPMACALRSSSRTGSELFSLTIADPTDLTPKPITGLTNIAVTAGQRAVLPRQFPQRRRVRHGLVRSDHHLPHRQRRRRRSRDARRQRPAGSSSPPHRPITPMAAEPAGDGPGRRHARPFRAPSASRTSPPTRCASPSPSTVRRCSRASSRPTKPERTIQQGCRRSLTLTLNQGDQILARIDADTRVNLFGHPLRADARLSDGRGRPGPDGARRNAAPQARPAGDGADLHHFRPRPGSQPTPFIAPGGPVESHPDRVRSAPAGFNGRITLAAKSGGALLAKQRQHRLMASSRDDFDGPVTLERHVRRAGGNAGVLQRRGHQSRHARRPSPLARRQRQAVTRCRSTCGSTPEIDPFGGGYRNWWFGDYTATDPAAPIDETLLRLPTSKTDDVFKRFVGMLPIQTGNPPVAIRESAAGSGPAPSPLAGALRQRFRVRRPDGFDPARRPHRRPTRRHDLRRRPGHRQDRQLHEHRPVRYVLRHSLSFGAAESDGTSGTDIDFFDFNGDGYPDVVAGGSLQATLPNGALEGRRIGLNGQSQVRQSAVDQPQRQSRRHHLRAARRRRQLPASTSSANRPPTISASV